MAISTIKKAMNDTGWLSVNGINYRKIGGIVFVEALSLSNVGQNVTIATLPVGFRPSIRHTESLSFPITTGGYVNFETNGNIAVINAQGVTLNNVYFSASFVAA